jgi:hypothetical protein
LGLTFCLLAFSLNAMPIIEGGIPIPVLVEGPTAQAPERWAADVLASHLFQLSNTLPARRTATTSDPSPGAIVFGTPTTHPWVRTLQAEGQLNLQGLGAEGYHLRLIRRGNGQLLAIAALRPQGVLYGAYALIEALTATRFGKTPVDVDFPVAPVVNLALDMLDERSTPFYPIRMALDEEDSDWLARHRINVSGAEGIWTGTGSDDGLGTAFQYVLGFDNYQDKPLGDRLALIDKIRRRTRELRERGIASYLFMYVTGEPTEALIRARPDLLGPAVAYGGSRNYRNYRPFCWSNPEVPALFASLTRELLRTYPDLTGLHLRAWGAETRACNCPECGDTSPQGQELLWNIVHTAIEAARAERPEFRLILSGYDASWLRDPARDHLQRLPSGTLILGKWGIDGEPTADPQIPTNLVNDIADAGHYYVVLSPDTEEVQPFWMLEAELFATGVRRTAENLAIRGLGGFTLAGQDGLGGLDKRLVALLNWNPRLNVSAFIQNALESQFGAEPAVSLLVALLTNTRVLSDFFMDYAGILTLTGGYRHGSASFATHMPDILGEQALRDIFGLPNREAAAYARQRLNALEALQENAVQAIQQALAAYQGPTDPNLQDAARIMDIWLYYFRSRQALVEAVALGYQGAQADTLQRKFEASIDFLRQLRDRVTNVQAFLPFLGLKDAAVADYLLKRIDAEIALLMETDPQVLIHPVTDTPDTEENPEERLFQLENALNAPNPVSETTSFIYTLTRDADLVRIDIYSSSGRRVRRIENAPTKEGYNEAYWDGRDADGRPVGNGVYFYRILARREEVVRRMTGRLAVLR